MKGVTILGCTGSVGRQALDVIRADTLEYRVVGLTANTSSRQLAEAVEEFRPATAALSQADEATDELRAACRRAGTELLLEARGIVEVAERPEGEWVLQAIVGAAGLPATAAAVRRGATVALANKESLVVAGRALTTLASESGGTLLPVDSEHAAIHQCLRAGHASEVRRWGPCSVKAVATATG